MALPDDTLVGRLMQEVRGRIAARALAPGARLPSIRAQAAVRGVSNNTVVEAYDRLAAEGVIEARRGSGFYVAGRAPPFSLAEAGPRLDREVDPLWVSRQSLEMPDAAAKPGCGWLPPSWMPEASLRRALRGMARADSAVLTDMAARWGWRRCGNILAGGWRGLGCRRRRGKFC